MTTQTFAGLGGIVIVVLGIWLIAYPRVFLDLNAKVRSRTPGLRQFARQEYPDWIARAVGFWFCLVGLAICSLWILSAVRGA
ncbi:hypothetical protein J7E25_17020 [Agromyces sp. ISL-38]|uniref:hypothetical protein n=1 Tax=Agromyces sp. ISL-38 TaxID=2819107 RepID=UPI001BE82CAA|nr:hypothetical protein [Agromyces sp. ISL-38]MBT2500800.1 hypothetical protein [Agromyces sp. ISL-38]MBT2519390.1 hypothetical protein [Streptomyces sp. ISL-90]